MDPYYFISNVLSSISKARRLKFVNLNVKAIWNCDNGHVRAHLSRVIPAFFADNENLRVLQIAASVTVTYSWKRRQGACGGEVGEAVVFTAGPDTTSSLPWSLSGIAELVDAYGT